ncbi:MAG TPA: ester cyclase [Candidatus Sulfomarinibacteraceae bacterium]|nr:ester cyclase [Candidatus Sulfomarinibacteraceae bacterium]
MSTEQHKALVRLFYEAFGAEDLDALREVLAPDLVAFSHAGPGAQNHEEHLQGIAMWLESFETRFDVEEQVAEGDKGATRVTLRAVHSRGDFMGVPPSGKEIELSGISIERVEDGRIAERWVATTTWG